MSELRDIEKAKFSSLLRAFQDFGYESSAKTGQREFRLFLNKKSSSGNFDSLLCDKLFEVLNIEENSKISIEEFIQGFLIFEEEVSRNAESFRIKLAKEQEIYNKILRQCQLYKAEKLNAEGFADNAKIYGEITDIDIKKKLEGIKELIIVVVFNNKKEELHFKIGDPSLNLKKSFEFKPTSKKDHFEFIMKGVNEKGAEFGIGSKIFPLDDIASQEEYFVQIIVPEIDNPEKIAAYINATIILYTSDYKYYESLRRKQEKRLRKYKNACSKAEEYLKYVRDIYGDLSLIKPELIVDFNNEKLIQRKGAKLNVNFNNLMEAEIPGANFQVEFNNERAVQRKGVPLRVEFNNSKEVITPIIETKKVEYIPWPKSQLIGAPYREASRFHDYQQTFGPRYSYQTNYNTTVEKNITTKTEENTQLIESKNKIIDTDIQQVPVLPEKKVVVKEEENINHIKLYSDVDNPEDNDVPQDLNENTQVQQVYTNEQMTKQQENYLSQLESQANLEKMLKHQQENSGQNNNIQTIQQIKNTEIVQTTSTPQYIQTQTQSQEQVGTNFDMDAFLKQGQYKSQNNTNGLEGYLQQQTTTENTQIDLNNLYGQQNTQEYGTNMEGYNFSNLNNIQTTTTTTTTNYQNQDNSNINWNINNGQEITTETKVLEPIINKVGVNVSVNKAIMKENTKKIVVSQNTLPVSYLPEKVNKVIVDSNVKTLPLITAGNDFSYNTLQPIVHETKVYLNESSNANNTNSLSGYNFEQTSNNITNYNNISSNENFDYSNFMANTNDNSANINYNFESNAGSSQNPYIEGNNYSYNFTTGNNAGNNVYETTKTVTTTTHTSSQNYPGYSFQAQTQQIPITGSQNNQNSFQFEEYKATSY